MDAVEEQVETLCSTFNDCFEDLGIEGDLGFETELDEKCVEADRMYIHCYLECIFRKRQMGGTEEQLRLQAEIDAQRRCIQSLKFIEKQRSLSGGDWSWWLWQCSQGAMGRQACCCEEAPTGCVPGSRS